MNKMRWTAILAGVACVVIVCICSTPKALRGFSMRVFAGRDWHIETGYLLDDAGPGPVAAQAFISGSFYRFGPMTVEYRWQSRAAVTNVLALPRTRRLL